MYILLSTLLYVLYIIGIRFVMEAHYLMAQKLTNLLNRNMDNTILMH